MIYIARYRGYENNQHKLEITKHSVSQEEYAAFMQNFAFYGRYHQFREMWEICQEASRELTEFLSPGNLNGKLREKGVDREKVLTAANRLLLNYCTAMKILVEKIESYLSQERPAELGKFRELCAGFYDNHFPYRFFMRLRNYVIHNEMPFTKVVSSLERDCGLYMGRRHLLKWTGWNTVREDLEKMEGEDLAVQPLLAETNSLLYVIYLQSLYYLAPDVTAALKNIQAFAGEHQLQLGRFEFVEFDSEEEFQGGKCRLYPVPWGKLSKCIQDMNKHPGIRIGNKADAGKES